jgi:hypothetical protein
MLNVTNKDGGVAHACNPSYSGGRDQEDHHWKPAPGTQIGDPILKKPITKRGWQKGSSGALLELCLSLSPPSLFRTPYHGDILTHSATLCPQ